MPSTFVYAIHNPSKAEVKIGYSNDPLKRLSQLQVATTDQLNLLFMFLGDITKEKEIHKSLETYRIRGEWFQYTTEVLNKLSEFIIGSCPAPPQEHQELLVLNEKDTEALIIKTAYSMTYPVNVKDIVKKLASLNKDSEYVRTVLVNAGAKCFLGLITMPYSKFATKY